MLQLGDLQVARMRSYSQLLTDAQRRSDLAGLASHLIAIQAQDRIAAALTVRPRTDGLTRADIDASLRSRGGLVLIWSLRGTLHYHDASDVRSILALVGPNFGKFTARDHQLGIDRHVGRAAEQALRRALETQGPLTRAQVRRVLEPVGVNPSGQAAVHVLHRAAMNGLICIVPQASGEERFTLLDDWVGPAGLDSATPAETAEQLLRRFVRAFGPVSIPDFRSWSGLPAGAVRQAWVAVAEELTEIGTGQGQRYVLSERLDELLAAAETPAPVRLVGGFDQLVLAYKDRRPQLALAQTKLVNAGGGLVSALLVDDGFVTGLWSRRHQRGTDQIEVTAFDGYPVPDPAAIESEIIDIRRFLGGALT